MSDVSLSKDEIIKHPDAGRFEIRESLPPQVSLLALTERLATNKDVDVDKLEKILNMQERIIDKEAEQLFNQAMARVQAEMPVIEKKAKNDQTHSFYATLGDVISTITPVFTKHGFSVSFNTKQSQLGDGFIKVIAYVSHSAGHTREYQHDLPIDDKGIKGNVNKIELHGRASAISYGQRYLLCLIFNLATGTDIDGNKPEAVSQGITEETLKKIIDALIPSDKTESECMDYIAQATKSKKKEGLYSLTEAEGIKLLVKLAGIISNDNN